MGANCNAQCEPRSLEPGYEGDSPMHSVWMCANCKAHCAPETPQPFAYRDETPRDRAHTQKILSYHLHQTECCNIPLQMFERSLVRPRDGSQLHTNIPSLADVDEDAIGDGIEIGEIVRAIVMASPGVESTGGEPEGGQRMFGSMEQGEPSYGQDHNDVGQFEEEVSLKAEVRDLEKQLETTTSEMRMHCQQLERTYGAQVRKLEEQLEKMHFEARKHRTDRERMQAYMQEKSETLQRLAIDLALDCGTQADKGLPIQQGVVDLANVAYSLSLDIISESENNNGADSPLTRL